MLAFLNWTLTSRVVPLVSTYLVDENNCNRFTAMTFLTRKFTFAIIPIDTGVSTSERIQTENMSFDKGNVVALWLIPEFAALEVIIAAVRSPFGEIAAFNCLITFVTSGYTVHAA